MVRFARAEGSKGSNKRVLEDATPWSEMVTQLSSTPGRMETIEVRDSGGGQGNDENRKKRKVKKEVNTKMSEKIQAEVKGTGKKQIKKEGKGNVTWYQPTVVRGKQQEEAGKDDEENPNQSNLKTDIEQKKLDCHKTITKKNAALGVENNCQNKCSVEVYNNLTKAKGPAEKKSLASDKNSLPFVFEENEVMTLYDGFWVKRDSVDHLDLMKVQKMTAILAARGDGSPGQEPTAEEACMFRRAMKKEKRRMHNKLIGYLKKQGRSEVRPKQHETVNFCGSQLKIETVKTLMKLEEELLQKGVSEEEVKGIIKKERRKEERALKLPKKVMCFQCRQLGHRVSDCPKGGKEFICYLCGSTEHKASDCNGKNKGKFVHATCYTCGESGHIARQCPSNPRGLYPNGGACKECGSVEHFAKNCPSKMKEKEESAVTAERLDITRVDALDL